MQENNISNKLPDAGKEIKIYVCGTLKYTSVGVTMLFVWLLWGDACYTLMEAVSSVVPLKLKALDCPNWLMGVILSTIPGFLNMTVCPWVSFKSDRHRGRWGRRIPFIVGTMPFLCACLILMGCSEDIAGYLRQHIVFLENYTPATLTILMIAVFMALFSFFNMFVSSVFWYLFNDVVPPQFLGRFIGLLKVVGTGAGALYNFFLFQYSESHFREILTGGALLYLIGFGLTCLMVREGKYPPVEEYDLQRPSRIENLKLFFRECFTNKFYWQLFAFTGISAFAGGIGMFWVFFSKEMGLNLAQIGRLHAIQSVVAVVAVLLVAAYVDRWHPFRVKVYASVFNTFGLFVGWIWLFITLPSEYYFWLCLGGSICSALQGAIVAVSALPKDMRMFPQSRFGQFCSAQSLLRSACTMVGGVLGGLFVDGMKWLYDGSDYCYRFLFAWNGFFTLIATVVLIYSYRRWYKLGGDSHYHPPAPWSHSGIEEMPITTTVGPQTKWLKIAFRSFDIIMWMSVAMLAPLLYLMYEYGRHWAFEWTLWLVLPLSVGVALLWRRVKGNINADITRIKNGENPRLGIPHHGMLVITGLKYVLNIGMWIWQIVITTQIDMQTAIVYFGIGNVLTNFFLVVAIWLLSWIERDYITVVDCNLSEATVKPNTECTA